MPSKDFIVKNGLIVTDDAIVNGTGAIKIPAGTTAQRTAGTAGDFRFNNELNEFEGYDGTAWTNLQGYTGSRGFSATTSDTPPTGISDGHMWFNTSNTTLNVYYDDGDSQQWVTTSGPAGPLGYTGSQGPAGPQGPAGSNVTVSATPPLSPTEGDLWWDEEAGRMYVYYDDSTSAQWVESSPATIGPTGYTGSKGTTGFTGSSGITSGKAIIMSMIFG